MKHRLAGLLGLTLLLLASPAAHAQSIWKWRDANGRMQMSDRAPPAEVPDKDILQRPGGLRSPQATVAPSPAASAASDAATDADGGNGKPAGPTTDPVLEARKKRLQQEQAAQKQARLAAEQERLAAQRADACQRARNYLTALESGQRVARPNERGEREVLDDAGRAQEIQRGREAVNAQCH